MFAFSFNHQQIFTSVFVYRSEEGNSSILTEQQMNGVDAAVIMFTGIPKKLVEKLSMVGRFVLTYMHTYTRMWYKI